MPHVQVRDVPADVHAALVRKAARAGQSLQQFLLAELSRLAERPTMAEVLDKIESSGMLADISIEDIVATIRADRESH